jgi:Family of unknown function (DUF6476)
MVDQQRDAGGYTPGQIRALKIAIGVMTVAIIAGLAVLVLTIAYRAAGGKRAAAPAPTSAVDLQALYPGSGPVALGKLPAGAHVVSVAPWGERLVLVVEDYQGSSVLALDPKTGRLEPLARLTSGR